MSPAKKEMLNSVIAQFVVPGIMALIATLWYWNARLSRIDTMLEQQQQQLKACNDLLIQHISQRNAMK